MSSAREAIGAVLVGYLAVLFAAAQNPHLEEVVGQLGLDPRQLGIQQRDLEFMIGRRPASPLTALAIHEPLRAEGFARVIGANLGTSAAARPQETLLTLSYFNSRKLFRGLLGDPTEAHKAAAKQPAALKDVLQRCGAEGDWAAKIEALPTSLKEAAAYLLLVELDADTWTQRAMAAFPNAFWDKQWTKLQQPLLNGADEDQQDREHPDPEFDWQQKQNIERFDANLMMAGAQDILIAVQAALTTLRADAILKDAQFDVQIKTRFGWVIFSDGRPQVHAEQDGTLLIIDTGGDDTYASAGANGGRGQTVSVGIDLGGNDTYRAPPNRLSSFGAGILGIGVLWDDGGDDHYDADQRSQGAAFFGVGVLLDTGGNDTYKAIDFSQGAAMAGYGLLIDRAGNDRYESFRNSQAYAGPNAGAALVDLAGDDVYVANDTDIRYPSPQTKDHNTSMSQGAATGFRADYSDGLSVNGGVAVLYDGGGQDTYTCGLFGQGVGYWQGLGLLIDAGGDDTYKGVWYVQGAAAHFAAGLLLDQDGNDHFTATMNMAQGAGHDLSVGILIDAAGNDVYEAPSLALGASNAAGFGLFVDYAGDDEYRLGADSACGWVSRNDGYRGLMQSYGLFLDLSGNDKYTGRGGQGDPVRKDAGNQKQWSLNGEAGVLGPFMRGIGLDR